MERREFLKAAAAGAAAFSVGSAPTMADQHQSKADGHVDVRQAPPCGLYCGLCDPKECHGCGCACGKCAGKAHQKICEIAQCALKRKVDSCGDCPDFACTPLIQFANDPVWRTHLPALDNLRRRKAIGTEKWLQEQKQYWSDEKHLRAWKALADECDRKHNERKAHG
jgi:anaerobic selenocysteine-containing dehydrogenase